jgi:outer membrane protein assembly factor BamB
MQSHVSAATAQWPCFHGPNRDNKSTETGLLKTWPEDGPELLWAATGLGKGYSSVSIADARIYTAGRIERKTYVFALDLDGTLQRRTPNGQSWETTMRHAIGYTGARSTPTYDQGRVYHLGEYGRLAALDAATGREIWHRDLLDDFDAEPPKYGMAESVLIVDDWLICSPGGARGFTVCLEKKTGKLVWANTEIPGTQAYCSPILAEFEGVKQVVSMSSEALFGLELATGKLLWSVEHKNARDNNATDPIYHEGHVFASSGYGAGSILVRLERTARGIETRTVWRSRLLDNHHGGVLLHEGHLYGAGHEARGWFCLDFMTGKQRWNARGKGSLTYADGMLYCLDERGTMTLVEATPEAYRPVSSFRVPRGRSGPYWAHPVVCGGRLYVRHVDRLFAYRIGKE